MSTVRRRRLAAAALVGAAAMTLSGCGTGFNAQTGQIYQASVGADHRGEVDVLGTLFVANDDGSATLSAGIINNTHTEQSLSSVTVTTLDDKDLPVRSLKTLLPLQAGILSPVGGASDAGGFRVTGGAAPGSYVRVTLSFTDSAPVTIEAPVVVRSAQYDKVAGNEPAPTPVADSAKDGAEGVDTK